MRQRRGEEIDMIQAIRPEERVADIWTKMFRFWAPFSLAFLAPNMLPTGGGLGIRNIRDIVSACQIKVGEWLLPALCGQGSEGQSSWDERNGVVNELSSSERFKFKRKSLRLEWITSRLLLEGRQGVASVRCLPWNWKHRRMRRSPKPIYSDSFLYLRTSMMTFLPFLTFHQNQVLL